MVSCPNFRSHFLNMFPFMTKPPQKEYIPHEYRMPLRVVGFVATVAIIWAYGDKLEMPENPRFA